MEKIKTVKETFTQSGPKALTAALVILAEGQAENWAKAEEKRHEGWIHVDTDVSDAEQKDNKTADIQGALPSCTAKVVAMVSFIKDKNKGKGQEQNKDQNKKGKNKDGPDDDDDRGGGKPGRKGPDGPKNAKEAETEDTAEDMFEEFEAFYEQNMEAFEQVPLEAGYAHDALKAQESILHALPFLTDIAQQVEMALLGNALFPANSVYGQQAVHILEQTASHAALGSPYMDILSMSMDYLRTPDRMSLAPEHDQALASVQAPEMHMDNTAHLLTPFEIEAPSFLPVMNGTELQQQVSMPDITSDLAAQALSSYEVGGQSLMAHFQDNALLAEPAYEMAYNEPAFDMAPQPTHAQNQAQYANHPYYINNPMHMAPSPNMSDPAFGGSGGLSGGDAGGSTGGGFSGN